MPRRTLLLTTILGLILLVVGTLDYFLIEQPHFQAFVAEYGLPDTAADGSASSRRVIMKGVSRKEQTNVEQLLSTLGFLSQETSDVSLLRLTAPGSERVQVMVLLKDNDRAALFAWLESPNVKDIFANLKMNLQRSFSNELIDLVDATAQADGGPVVNTLSFFDPAVAPEKLIFLRVRTRLYEVHIAKGYEDEMSKLIEELVK